ncbi:MAG: hypothetical protein KIT14_10675 [bacterium]|nr:hypothetical protein [bacterium]
MPITRRRLPLLALLALAACGGGTSSSPSDADLVLPGTFSEETTVEDLKTRYGAANVVVGELPDGEKGLILFPNDPTLRAYVRFYDEEPMGHLAAITVVDRESRWRGKGGVRIGMSLAEVVEKNANRFLFNGFDEKHEAQVRDYWDAGKLDVQEGDRLYFGVDLRLRAPVEQIPKGDYPSDGGQWSTDDPQYPRLGEIAEVSAMSAWSSLDDEWSGLDRGRLAAR